MRHTARMVSEPHAASAATDDDAVASGLYARFWGVRGSIPVSGPDHVRYGGNTSCVEIGCGGHVFVFDAGSGLREFNAAHAAGDSGRTELDLFLSHSHVDHLLGLPFFGFAHTPGNTLRIWSGHRGGVGSGATRQVVEHLMSSPLFPIGPDIFAADVSFLEFDTGVGFEPKPGVSIRTAPLNHPDGAVGYRVEHGGRSICYVTDTEHLPDAPDRNILGLIDGADLLIYDTMFTDEELKQYRGWGHSTWEEAIRLCRAAGVPACAMFHHAPERDDDALDRIGDAARASFAGAVMAREGMVLRP